MRIGIIGAGQLGQMLGIAARDLDIECRFLDPATAPPAASVGPVISRPFDDAVALAALADDCDIVTYEFENVPVEALLRIDDRVTVCPPPEALRVAQDRLAEKKLFDSLRIPLARYRAIKSLADLKEAASSIGLPLIVKTRRHGYDGKGQLLIQEKIDIDKAWRQLGAHALIAEQWIPFDREVSVIGVRNADGDVAIYPLTHNEHVAGILRRSRAPVDAPQLTKLANRYVTHLLKHLNYVGVLALEFFVTGDRLLANEFAPRVHNSGHWTIEGSTTSQFSNHLHAISGQQPGPTTCRGHAGMLNLIGTIPDAARRISNRHYSFHDYGKESRPGRKLGHITVVAGTATERDRLLDDIDKSVTGSATRQETSNVHRLDDEKA